MFENLLCPNWSKVSKKQPYRVQQNVAFLINLGDEDPMMMIRNLESDDNGAYKCMGTRTTTWQTVVEILDDFKVKEFKMSKKKETLTTSDEYHLVSSSIDVLILVKISTKSFHMLLM